MTKFSFIILVISDLTDACSNIKSFLNETHDVLIKRIELLQKFILITFSINPNSNKIKYNYTEFVTDNIIEFSKDILIMNHQHEIYVTYLIKFMEKLEKEINDTIHEYTLILQHLHEIVQFRTAIATDKVFVSYKNLR